MLSGWNIVSRAEFQRSCLQLVVLNYVGVQYTAIQHFQAQYSVTFATINESTFVYYLQLWSSETAAFLEVYVAKWCTKGSLVSSCTPSKLRRASGNILGHIDTSLWNAGIPIRLQIAQSTAYLPLGFHVFWRLNIF